MLPYLKLLINIYLGLNPRITHGSLEYEDVRTSCVYPISLSYDRVSVGRGIYKYVYKRSQANVI